MPLSSQRQRFSIFVSPRNEDFLFYEKVDKQRIQESIPEYGDPHPDFRKYPNHFFSQAVQADEEGQVYYYYYAAKRSNQDEYNWEHVTVDYRGQRYDTVQRSYVTLRSEYDEDSPSLGSTMPLTKQDPFDGSDLYVLTSRNQSRIGDSGRRSTKIGDKELDSMFVLETHTYTKRVPITQSSYNKSTGSHTISTTRLVHRDEVISKSNRLDIEPLFYLQPDGVSLYLQPDGVSRYAVYGSGTGSLIEEAYTPADLIGDLGNDFWKTDSENGAHNQIEQVSEEWYFITVEFNTQPDPKRVFIYPTPDQKDFLFYDILDRKDETAAPTDLPAYGEAHPEFLNHKFVAAVPSDGTGDFYRYFYASDRSTQNTYNWEHATTDLGGTKYDTVERNYIIPRDEYSEDSPALATPMPVTSEDPFSSSDNYILLKRQKQSLPSNLSELESVYVQELRTYIKRTPLTQTSYSDSTGYHTFRQTEILHKTESPTGEVNNIAYLVDNTDDNFWSTDEETGAHKVVDQVSSDWYAVTSVFDGEKNDRRVFTYVSPDQDDFIFYELIDRKDEKSEPENLPSYGESHPSLRSHKFVASVPADSNGDFYRYYYAAERADQDDYNWDHNTADLGGRKFDTVTSTNIVLRSKYSRTSEPDPPSKFSEYVYMSKSQSQVTGGDDILRSLFVVERVQYIRRVTITKQTYDNELGSILTSTVELFRTGDQPEAQGLDPEGFITEIRQLSTDWVSVEKRQVINVGPSGKIREFLTTENTTWPAVLDKFVTNAWAKRDGSYRYLVYPDYKRYGYQGPTSVLVEQFWQPEPFQGIGPDAPMIPVPLEVQTPIGATYRSIPTLHEAQKITGTTGTTDATWEYLTWNVNFPATEPADWPDELVVSDDQRPYRGGYIRQKMTAYRPSTTGQSGYASDGGNDIGGPSVGGERPEDVYKESTDSYTVTYGVTSEQTGFSITRTATIPAIEYLAGVRKEDETVDRFTNEGPIPTLPASVVQAAESGINITGPFYWTNADDNWTARTGDDIFEYGGPSIWSPTVLSGPYDNRKVNNPKIAIEDIQRSLLPTDSVADRVKKMGTFLHDCGLATQVDNLNTKNRLDGKFYITNYEAQNFGLYSARPLKEERNKLTPRPQSEMTPMYEPASDYCLYYPRTRYTSTYGSETGEAYQCVDLRYRQYFYFYSALATSRSLTNRFNPFGIMINDNRVQSVRYPNGRSWAVIPKVGDPDPEKITQPEYIKYTHTNAPSSSWTPSYTGSTTTYSGATYRNYENDNMVPLRAMHYNVITPVPSASGLTLDDLEVYVSGTDTWVWAHPVTGDPFLQVSQSETGTTTYRQYAYTQGIEGQFSSYSPPEDHLLLLPAEVGGRVTRVVFTLAASDEAVENRNNEFITNPNYPAYVNLFDSLDPESYYFYYNNAQRFIDNLTTLRYVLWEDTQTNT